MTSYELLVNVLDKLRTEAPETFRKYHAHFPDTDAINSARARAFIHLFLKVRFGLLTFAEREGLLTEGADDGGIDAYYIDTTRRVIYFIQSKFRTTQKNFESKSIDPEELLMMDINRIMEGEEASEAGVPYNNKIKSMIRKIHEIEDIGRYSYRVVILANIKGITRQKIVQLTGGFATDIIDYATCYKTLLFPLISGTFFNADSLNLHLNLSNKNAGTKITYTVTTQHATCDITVVFVPTLEIAKAMYKYRNTILQYNPRSYLGHEGKNVNGEIRKSIESRTTNEFALFNNGLTVLSDETYLNERIGLKGVAQLRLVNPQIINGGQTAYTLSSIYRENLEGNVESLFAEKEVLMKIITFPANGLTGSEKLNLIEDISRATNQQTEVTAADRRSNDVQLKVFQDALFQRAGLLMERKRGEFEDGRREGYILERDIVDRNLVFRVILLLQKRFTTAFSRKVAVKINLLMLASATDESIDRIAFSMSLLKHLNDNAKRRNSATLHAHLFRVYFATAMWFAPGLTGEQRQELVETVYAQLEHYWSLFMKSVRPEVTVLLQEIETRRKGGPARAYFTSEKVDTDIATFRRTCEDDRRMIAEAEKVIDEEHCTNH